MRIQLTFDNWDDVLQAPVALYNAVAKLPMDKDNTIHLGMTAKLPKEPNIDTQKKAEPEAGFTAVVDSEVPFETAEAPAAVPAAPAEDKPKELDVKDIQAAVRDVVKTKGKEAAREILSKFTSAVDESKPATRASELKPESYAECYAALKEALNA